MSTAEIALVYAGIPLLVILVVFALVYATSAARSKRYRPGRPYATAPAWFLAAEDPTHPTTTRALPAAETVHGEVGGASDNW